jgi:hypothetical protein
VAVQAYSAATSVAAGGSLDFHLNDGDGGGTDAIATVTEFASGRRVFTGAVHADANPTPDDPGVDRGWPVGFTLDVPGDWASGLYFADFAPAHGDDGRAYFVVRAAEPGRAARILVSVPFPTWHAYSYAGTPGASPYWNEQSDRGHRVSLHRPIGPPGGHESPSLQWLGTSGFAVEYCSGYDLHDGADLLGAYQLLVCLGHDEYWSAGMRDTVEEFLAKGGNAAFLTGNTCWWQFRLEDEGRTFVCYRDAFADPLSGVDDRHVTVEWGSAPVNRPENTLTGVSFRYGAGCWNDPGVMANAAWTVAFPEHWVLAGTGLAAGARFGTGTVGYETDAAETVAEAGVPRVTGRDGTPHTFVVVATADLGSWRDVGQGGAATMGVFRAPGGGTVFTASTIAWGFGLSTRPDPAVVQITRNVLGRLSQRYPGQQWERIGGARVSAMVACENRLYASDVENNLWIREPVGQNLGWTRLGHAINVRALASAREEMFGRPIGLFAVTTDDQLWRRVPWTPDVGWTAIGTAPGVVALAVSYETLFGATSAGELVVLGLGQIAPGAAWRGIGAAENVVAMTNLSGRLYAVRHDGQLMARLPALEDAEWVPVGPVPGTPTALAGWAGKLFVANTAGELHWRDAVP